MREAGFEWVDFSELVQPEIDRNGTQFAAFALYIEQNHWSREGTRRVADRVQPLLAEAAAAPSAAPTPPRLPGTDGKARPRIPRGSARRA